MSRQLPPHPSLEHLRKQAKELLEQSQQRDPTLRLADAQFALARAYGFASWPKLKAYVESVARPPSRPAGRSPFAGTWTADVTRSRRHPANEFRSATLRVDVDGDLVTIADVVVDAAGREAAGEHTVRADGAEHAAGNGYALTATWRGPRVLETVARKDGQVVGRGTYAVSDDGATLTVATDEQLLVLGRR
jgi:hypothetical protein